MLARVRTEQRVLSEKTELGFEKGGSSSAAKTHVAEFVFLDHAPHMSLFQETIATQVKGKPGIYSLCNAVAVWTERKTKNPVQLF